MPPSLNPRRDKFAQNLVAGMCPEAAYAAAGYKPHRQNAHRMMTDDDIRARVEELRAPVVREVRWDNQNRLEMLLDIALAAQKDKDYRAVIAAVAEANKMEGIYKPAPKDKDGDSLADALAKFMQDIVASKPALPVGPARLRQQGGPLFQQSLPERGDAPTSTSLQS